MLTQTQPMDPTPIPHEPGQTMTFRPLSWDELDRAALAKTREKRELIAGMGKIDFSGVAEELQKLSPDDLAKVNDAASSDGETHEQKYDKGIVLECGVAAWSYDEPVIGAGLDDKGKTIKVHNTRRLDPKTATWAFEQVMVVTFPRSADEGEA